MSYSIIKPKAAKLILDYNCTRELNKIWPVKNPDILYRKLNNNGSRNQKIESRIKVIANYYIIISTKL